MAKLDIPWDQVTYRKLMKLGVLAFLVGVAVLCLFIGMWILLSGDRPSELLPQVIEAWRGTQ